MKTLLISLSILILVSLFAEKTLNVFKNNLTVLNIATTSVDSVKFSTDNMNIHKSDNSTVSMAVASIDSLNFSESTPQTLPAVDTLILSSVQTPAIANIKIKSTGGTSIVTKGICWSTTENPTIDNSKLASTTLLANSTVDITGLTAATKYYARAYANYCIRNFIQQSGYFHHNKLRITNCRNHFCNLQLQYKCCYLCCKKLLQTVVAHLQNGVFAGVQAKIQTTANSKFCQWHICWTVLCSDVRIKCQLNLLRTGICNKLLRNGLWSADKVQALMGNVTIRLMLIKRFIQPNTI